MEIGMVFVLALCYINVFCEVGNCHYWGWHELFVQFHEISLNVNFKEYQLYGALMQTVSREWIAKSGLSCLQRMHTSCTCTCRQKWCVCVCVRL